MISRMRRYMRLDVVLFVVGVGDDADGLQAGSVDLWSLRVLERAGGADSKFHERAGR